MLLCDAKNQNLQAFYSLMSFAKFVLGNLTQLAFEKSHKKFLIYVSSTVLNKEK